MALSPSTSPGTARRSRTKLLALVLGAALVGIALGSVRLGSSGTIELDRILQGALALLGLGEPLPGPEQTIVEWRLYRTVVAIGVGAALALSGGILQGVFRNDLASPSLLGVSSGAAFGASLAMLTLGGYGPDLFGGEIGAFGPLLVTGAALVGALSVAWIVTVLGTTGGRLSVPTLLLVGIAINAVMGGAIAAVQSFVLRDYELAQAIFAWTFGTLDDRTLMHVGLILGGLAVAVACIPFIAVELDLFVGGEEDAAALGVDTQRVKLVALVAAALAAAVAVSVAGQIAFVGLLVPHLLRLLGSRAHGALLPLCLLGGPVLFVGSDLLQRWALGSSHLQPGVTMSLLGGPYFLFLLVRNRSKLRAW